MASVSVINLYSDNVSTSGTTPASIITVSIETFPTYSSINCFAQVGGYDRINNLGGGYYLSATFKYNGGGGAPVQVGSTTVISSHEDDADWDATITLNGTSIIVQVTGGAGQIVDWAADMKVIFVNNT